MFFKKQLGPLCVTDEGCQAAHLCHVVKRMAQFSHLGVGQFLTQSRAVHTPLTRLYLSIGILQNMGRKWHKKHWAEFPTYIKFPRKSRSTWISCRLGEEKVFQESWSVSTGKIYQYYILHWRLSFWWYIITCYYSDQTMEPSLVSNINNNNDRGIIIC